ncbi:prephenate dehydrogenase/arogenate dehydrogenase family protein [Patescibacteria group bacterium]|nr:prephenate dehydrogenase/arogenate dehydrogenase family protein [Patescibacteria group bacterium]
MKTLGIIGFGAFSELMVQYLKPYFKVMVSSHRDVSRKVATFGIAQVSIEQVASCDIVIIGVVVEYFEDILKQIKGHVKPGVLIIDVASVKMKPASLMEKYLPAHVEILATHPLFGPQSARNGIDGSKIVLCPIRTKSSVKVKNFLEDELKLDVLIRTPKEHDEAMAYVLSLTHFIGRAVNEMDIPFTHLNTQTYKHLLSIKELIGKDSFELFKSIQNDNPYAKKVRQDFLKKIIKLEDKLVK